MNICVVSLDDASSAVQSLPEVGVAEDLLAAEPHGLDLLLAAALVLTDSPCNASEYQKTVFPTISIVLNV